MCMIFFFFSKLYSKIIVIISKTEKREWKRIAKSAEKTRRKKDNEIQHFSIIRTTNISNTSR